MSECSERLGAAGTACIENARDDDDRDDDDRVYRLT